MDMGGERPAGPIEEGMRRLKALKGAELDLSRLAETSAMLAPLLCGGQARRRPAALPGGRAIRYYMRRGLVERPLRRGRKAVFAYRHLLQVLVIKKLQADYVPLRRIAESMGGLTDRQMERLLAAPEAARPVVPAFERAGRQARRLRAPAPPPEAGWSSWRKFRIDERIELHVESGFDPLDPRVDLEAVAGRIMRVLSMPPPGRKAAAVGARLTAALMPAPPVSRLSGAVVALITEGGLVPRGNPDGLEASKATRFFRYSIAGMGDLSATAFESIDRGWDTARVNEDPDRLLPLDVMREYEEERVIGGTYRYFYTTTGVAMAVDAAREIGRGIAAELRREGVAAAILTAT